MDEEEYTLETLPKGSIFRTADGVYAVKSEYRYTNNPDSQWLCVLLASGEFAHFPEKNATKVERCAVARLSGWKAYSMKITQE